jgi:hypothetical protein
MPPATAGSAPAITAAAARPVKIFRIVFFLN